MSLVKYPFFSKDKKGNLIRNYYCNECHIGPFLEDDVRRNLLIELGGERQPIFYCRKCHSIKFITKILSELPEEYKEREKYIQSGKALEDLANNNNRVLPKKEVIIPEIEEDTETPIELIEDILEETPEEDHEVATDLRLVDLNKLYPKNNPSKEYMQGLLEIQSKAISSTAEPVIEEINNKDSLSLEVFTGKQIIDLVKEKTGQIITISPKSKKLIIKYALKYLNGEKLPLRKKVPLNVNIDTEPNKELEVAKTISTCNNNSINLMVLSGKQIIDMVKEKTGSLITISPKSKKGILKYAQKYLEEKGFSVLI